MSDAIAAQRTDRFELLYTLYAGRVRAYVAAYLGRTFWPADPSLVDDLTQDTWEQVWRSLPTLRASDDRAMGWLTTVARRAVIAHYRRARTRREAPADFDGPQGRLLPVAPSAEDQALADDIALAMLREPVPALGVAA